MKSRINMQNKTVINKQHQLKQEYVTVQTNSNAP